MIAAGIRRVFVGVQDPNPQVAGKGLAQLRDAGIAAQAGLLQAQAEGLVIVTNDPKIRQYGVRTLAAS